MSENTKAPLVVVGAGYVGLVTAVALAECREIRLVDEDHALIDHLRRGDIPICEPGLGERFQAVYPGNLELYTDLDEALRDGAVPDADRRQFIFIAVGTPARDRRPRRITDERRADVAEPLNLDAVFNVIRSLLEYKGIAAVMKSTVLPGTGHRVLDLAGRQGSDLIYLSCPEFLQEGDAFKGVDDPDRIVVGSTGPSWATDELRCLHDQMHTKNDVTSPPRYLETDLRSAELLKLASNLCLAARIAITNHIANLCEEVGADVSDVMTGVGADSRIGPEFLNAGIGWGGSCFPKDIRALDVTAREAKVDLSLATSVLATNAEQPLRVVKKLERYLGDLDGKRVAILGLAFKPKTDDLRGSPALVLAHELREMGATVQAWDPEPRAREHAQDHSHLIERSQQTQANDAVTRTIVMKPLTAYEIAESDIDAMDGAHAVVLATAWPNFLDIDWCDAADAMAGTLVIDGRNHLDPEAVRAAGLQYEGTGRESTGLHRPLLEGAAEG